MAKSGINYSGRMNKMSKAEGWDEHVGHGQNVHLRGRKLVMGKVGISSGVKRVSFLLLFCLFVFLRRENQAVSVSFRSEEARPFGCLGEEESSDESHVQERLICFRWASCAL